eukprot:1154048-Pelagomonas_calceolata.AAC.2
MQISVSLSLLVMALSSRLSSNQPGSGYRAALKVSLAQMHAPFSGNFTQCCSHNRTWLEHGMKKSLIEAAWPTIRSCSRQSMPVFSSRTGGSQHLSPHTMGGSLEAADHAAKCWWEPSK